MATAPDAPLDGRRRQAQRNDGLILESARRVFMADPSAPIGAVAKDAGVGIGALYRRWGSKEALLLRLCLDGLRGYRDDARAVLDAFGNGSTDPELAWSQFTAFAGRCVDAGMGSMSVRLAGQLPSSAEVLEISADLGDALRRLVGRLHELEVLRCDIDDHDLSLIFEQIQAVTVADADRVPLLRQRYLALALQACRAPGSGALPGPGPSAAEIAGRYAGGSR